jgi:hypothetical protein
MYGETKDVNGCHEKSVKKKEKKGAQRRRGKKIEEKM